MRALEDLLPEKDKKSVQERKDPLKQTNESRSNSICRTNSRNSIKKVESLVDLAKAALSSLCDVS